MKILIDGHMIGNHEGGNERYIKNLYQSIKKINSNKDSIYLLTKKQSGNDLFRLFFKIPFLVKKEKINIVHSSYLSPFIKNCKQVVTVHDVLFRENIKFYSLKDRFIFYFLFPFSLIRADAIITPSLFSKNEIIKYYPRCKNKVYVINDAADPLFYQQKHKKTNERYILTINSRHPKKNINLVVQTFADLVKEYKDIKLVIIGGKHNINKSLLLTNNLIIYDHVSDKKLNELYNNCLFFIAMSVYEGFNLPIVEAAKTNALIIASDISVNREIARGKLVYVDYKNKDSLLEKIRFFLENPKAVKDQKKLNKFIISNYSWNKTAKETLKIYKLLMKR